MKKMLLLFFLAILSYENSAQQRIVIGMNPLRGRSVDFSFRSLSEIANGKSLGAGPGYTEVYIYLDTIHGPLGIGSDPEVKGWKLYAYALTPTLEGDFGGGNIDLTEINLNCTPISGIFSEIKATSSLSADPNNYLASGLFGQGDPGGKSNLSDIPPETLAYFEWRFTISYDCALEPNASPNIGLLGFDPDYYYTDLILYISPTY